MRSYVASLTVCLGSIALGIAIGYPSPAIPNLNAHRNQFHVDPISQSWINSILTIGAMVSSVLAGPMVNRFGRKLTLMMSALPSVLGWTLVASSTNAGMMEAGRFMTGIGIGIWDVGAPTYIAEISKAEVRGFLGSCFELSINFGILFVYLLGHFLSWRWLAVTVNGIVGATALLLAFMPETPRWLLMMGHHDEAVRNLEWLRGDASITEELKAMTASLPEGSQGVKLSDFRKKCLYQPALIVAGLMAFHSFTGIDAVLAYTVNIFMAAKVDINPYTQTIMIGVVGFAGNLLSTLMVDRIGRRALLLISGVTITTSMGFLSAYFLLLHQRSSLIHGPMSWLPLTSLIVYQFAFSMAYGPVPFVMMSELLPTRARGTVGGIVVAILYGCSFLIIKSFVNINMATFEGGAFFVYTACTALSLGFVYFCVPETKGKTLEEIEKYFR